MPGFVGKKFHRIIFLPGYCSRKTLDEDVLRALP